MKPGFYIKNDCLKIRNNDGIIMSIGGDGNCRGDGIKDRISVCFHRDNNSGWEQVELCPEQFRDQYFKENYELHLWNSPEMFRDLLVAHMG